MPANTPALQIPYPLPADAVTDYPSLGAQLASKLDGLLRIADIVAPAAGLASIDFASIPQTFNHLRMVASLRCTAGTTFQSGTLRFNGNTGNSYQTQRLRAFGTNVAAYETLNGPGVTLDLVGAGMSPGIFGMLIAEFPGYRDAGRTPVCRYFGHFAGSTGSTGFGIEDGLGLLSAALAINRITIAPDAGQFAQGSHATLYGLP